MVKEMMRIAPRVVVMIVNVRKDICFIFFFIQHNFPVDDFGSGTPYNG